MRIFRAALARSVAASIVLAASFAFGPAEAETVKFWYHFDNPENPMAALVAEFEAKHPGISIEAENVPWNSYYDNLYTAIVGGSGPDAAMVKLFAQPRLVEMGALEPIGDRIDRWPGKSDLLDNLLELNKGPEGQQYYLPVQYVVLYLYYRADLFKAAGLEPPKTCDEFRTAAIKLTKDGVYGFGFRGGKGGQDHWGPFVLGNGATLSKGGLTTPEAIKANQWLVDLFRVDKVFPPSAPNDGFQETIAAFKAGKTAMTIHHIGSSNDMVKALGDKVAAVPVPTCGSHKAWTAYGDESLAVFSASKSKDAAWQWIAFLAEGDHNVAFNQATGQLTVTKSGSAGWKLHEKRFVDATIASLPSAAVLPQLPETADFVNTVWPTAMQRALTGQITAGAMMTEIQALYAK
jgi:multiple sugar transport system substrate-binding protein